MNKPTSESVFTQEISYPIFTDPEHFLKLRKGNWPFSLLKARSERKAIKKCLGELNSIKSICDTPCGPGRLFEYWKDCGYETYAVELSKDFIPAAKREHQDQNLKGEVIHGDAFKLPEVLPHKVDCVVSVRFLYYFDKNERMQLLKKLAEASNKYVLVQYKSLETRKGKKKYQESLKKERRGKHFMSHAEMREEVEAAGLRCLKVVPISNASDRVFVICSVCESPC